jgi:glycerol uptake facilitator-like aquaporin
MNSTSPAPSSRSRNLLGVLSFLKPYRGKTTLAIGMLLVIIGLEMTLPRVSGTAINQMRSSLGLLIVRGAWQGFMSDWP